MRLYELKRHGGSLCCSCKSGVLKPHAPLKNKRVGGAINIPNAPLIKVEKLTNSNEPIPNTEELQRKLALLSQPRKKGKFVTL